MTEKRAVPNAAPWLWCCGVVLVALSALLAWLSRSFAFESEVKSRPLILFIVLVTVMFVTHWFAFQVALKLRISGRLVAGIWAVAIATRLLILPSHPIQEVDLYRYLWDGRVTCGGVSPYRYPPATVIASIDNRSPSETRSSEPRLAALAQAAAESESVATILRRVHFADLPTVYPPVSQAVFALVAAATPSQASVHVQVMAMKSAIVVFDLGIIAVLFFLLRRTGLHAGWAIAYAWNPLVLKEFAGSGHMDSIAVFFCMLSVALVCAALSDSRSRGWIWAAVSLALAFGAKLYPIVLLPVLVVGCWKARGLGQAAGCGVVFLMVAAACGLPMVLPAVSPTSHPLTVGDSTNSVGPGTPEPIDIFDELQPPLPDAIERVVAQDTFQTAQPMDGIATFLSRWEINDLIFLVIVENSKSSGTPPWFRVVPESRSRGVTDWVGRRWGVDEGGAAFLIARCLTLLMFVLCATWFIIRMPALDAVGYGRTVFLVIALFWALSPTLNPWYWTWALPLVCFSGARGWLLVSGMLTLYYLRFWMIYQSDQPIMQWAPYAGELTFDYVIVFVEHLPWMLLVTWQSWSRAAPENRVDQVSPIAPTL